MFDPFLGLAKCAGHIHHDDDDVRVPHALLHDGDDQEVNYFYLIYLVKIISYLYL